MKKKNICAAFYRVCLRTLNRTFINKYPLRAQSFYRCVSNTAIEWTNSRARCIHNSRLLKYRFLFNFLCPETFESASLGSPWFLSVCVVCAMNIFVDRILENTRYNFTLIDQILRNIIDHWQAILRSRHVHRLPHTDKYKHAWSDSNKVNICFTWID